MHIKPEFLSAHFRVLLHKKPYGCILQMRRTIAVLNARASILNNQNKAQVVHQQEASIHTSNAVKH